MVTGIFPGSFDPPTNGHIEVIRRAAAVFQRFVVVVMINSEKHTMFSGEERVDLIRRSVSDLENVEVMFSDELTIDFAKRYSPAVIVKGLRTSSDFDYEAMIAGANMDSGKLDTMFFVSSPELSRVNSTVVREFASRGGDASVWVPEPVNEALKAKFSQK